MFILRNFRMPLQIQVMKYSYSNLSNENFKAIKEIVKTVHPFSQINVHTNFDLILIPFDVVSCPNSNKLSGKILSNSNLESNVPLPEVNVNIYDKFVEISSFLTNNTLRTENYKFLLEVPIKCDLEILCENSSANVSDMYSDILKITAENNIHTKNLRCSIIDIASKIGDIFCNGLLLGQRIDIHTKKNGNIYLDKLQGDLLHCKTFEGNIDANSCYVEKSNFVTENGNLNLRNIHKSSDIYVLKEGNIVMSGINGNINIKSNGGTLNLQFSEMFGENVVAADNTQNAIINISEAMEKKCFIEAKSYNIQLEKNLEHLSNCLTEDDHFILGDETNNDKLLINIGGELKLGKMSWAESLKASFAK